MRTGLRSAATRVGIGAAMCLTALALAVGCSGGGDDSSDEASSLSSTSSGTYTTQAEAYMEAGGNSSGFVGSEPDRPTGTGAEALRPSSAMDTALGAGALKGREVMYSAGVDMVSDDVVGSADRAAVVAVSHEGYVEHMTISTKGRDRAEVLARVPVGRFAEFVGEVRDIAGLESLWMSAADQTAESASSDYSTASIEGRIKRLKEELAADYEARVANPDTDYDVSYRAGLLNELEDAEEELAEVLKEQGLRAEQVAYSSLVATFVEEPQVAPQAALRMRAWTVSGSEGLDPCEEGVRVLRMESDDESLSICAELENAGEAVYSHLSFAIPSVGAHSRDFEFSDESLLDELAPGDVILARYQVEVSAEGTLDGIGPSVDGSWAAVEIEAYADTPRMDYSGADSTMTHRAYASVEVIRPIDGSWPGFFDAWERGAAVAAGAIGVAVLVAGFVLPVLPAIFAVAVVLLILAAGLRKARSAHLTRKGRKDGDG